MKKYLPILLGCAAVAAWTGFVLWQGQHPGKNGPYEYTGQFGDSFGVVSALMAGLAAVLAYRAYIHGREQAQNAAASQQLRDDELTFFRMLGTRRDIIREFDFSERRGLSAATTLALKLREFASRRFTRQDWPIWLPKLYRDEVAEGEGKEHLWHYFRFTYHILLFVEERFQDPDVAYGYARMLRAELSDAEQLLIALNGLYFDGDDEGKMKRLIETFALLHNIREGSKEAFGLNQPGAYAAGAFRRTRPEATSNLATRPIALRRATRGTDSGGSVKLSWSRWKGP